ncbi:FecCD family ABC transporter permease [Dissulfurimicrobium hydrothermale]|uniref:FecCD family ABC transporter permease n=1 Tax=Dissulfurimicrobium hydrothermale TaxID=1750598 RepID=UPI001EDC161F|nr:iron ABC transporter permease [Dissulfurimicrobium hydrothermale]UKL13404.1 iron ABC transporter permease [Dissulfurimicrobium hydrothermale]
MRSKRPVVWIVLLSPILAGMFSIFMGAYNLSFFEVLSILFNGIFKGATQVSRPEAAIIFDIRLPRILLAGLVGVALSGSGAALQGIFRNPLVDPYLLGISAGAAFGCAVSIGFLPWIPVQVSAFFFGMLAVALTFLMASAQGEILRLSLVLSGVVVSSFFTAMLSIVKFMVDPNRLQSIVFWLMGSFSLSDWRSVRIAFLGVVIGMSPVFFMRWRLNAISMGDDEARALGVNVRMERMMLIGSTSLVVSIAVSVSGIIGWVGLMVPHLIRMMSGPDHKMLLPLSIAGGAAFMILADTISRGMSNLEIPVGIITAISGAPFFMYLMRRGEKGLFKG